MHRWFRFCAVIALMAFSQSPLAQSAPSENEVPASKHRLKATPTEILQHDLDEQSKKTEQFVTQLSAQLEAQNKLIEAQGKQLADLAQRAELQTKQIETLNADLNRLTQVLLARGAAEPAAPATSASAQAHPAEPAATVVKPAEPAAPAPDTFAPDGTPTHLVKRGETLTTIARQRGTTVSELLRINKIEDERKLQIGQTLLLSKPASPANAPAAAPATPPTPNTP